MNFSPKKAVPWLRQLVAGHLPRYPGPITRQSMCEFLWTKGHWDRGFAQYHSANAPHSYSFTPCSYQKGKYRSLSTLEKKGGFLGNQGALETTVIFSALKDYSRRKNVAIFPQIAWCLLTHPPNMFERKHTFSKYGISIQTAC